MINFKELTYWQLRAIIAKIVPGMTQFRTNHKKVERVQEKGRKKNYSEFKLDQGAWVKQERLLNNTEINSFLEISVRAAACPMPFNMDVWDSLNCPFSCIYCFPSGTQIMMVDGTEKSIERISVGDRVMSFNETTKQLEPAEVTQPMKRHYNSELICIEIEDGKVLKMTPEHPIYTQRGWIEAKELNTKDEVLIW